MSSQESVFSARFWMMEVRRRYVGRGGVGGRVSGWLSVSSHVFISMIFYNNERFRTPMEHMIFC